MRRFCDCCGRVHSIPAHWPGLFQDRVHILRFDYVVQEMTNIAIDPELTKLIGILGFFALAAFGMWLNR